MTPLKDDPYVPQYTFEYSIGGFTIAGAMLEVATNKTFEELCQELLFDPLEMEGCGFGPTTTDPTLPPNQPWGHLSDVWAYRNLPSSCRAMDQTAYSYSRGILWVRMGH